MDTFKTIENRYEHLYKEKASKFFALLFPVASEDDVKRILEEVKKEYYDSHHVCYAYVMGADKTSWRVNDAGEPSNTAGKPILGQLTAFDVTNALLIVVRYFGGTKLGVGGLIQAYKTSAQLVLQQAMIVERDVVVKFDIKTNYDNYSAILKAIKSANGKIITSKQTETCEVECEIPVRNDSAFNAMIRLKYLDLKKHE